MNKLKTTSFFHCSYEELNERLRQINPVDYARTRNYLDGDVTWLSPFITHGIITTKSVADAVLVNNSAENCEKLLFELAWREYFHRVWQQHGIGIFSDLKNPGQSHGQALPQSVCEANTGIRVIDDALNQLISVGTLHNHARMWIASLCCNIGNTHWLPAAKWMHYHLLDGDLASNTLSWQWIAGTFSHKRYYANQENINKFSKSVQRNTFLDVPYNELPNLPLPESLQDTLQPKLDQMLPGQKLSEMDNLTGAVALRSVWQLDPHWQPTADHHLLFIDEELHNQWPMSRNRWAFILHWALAIPNAIVVKGSVEELKEKLANANVSRQEYTAVNHWSPQTEDRTWLYRAPTKRYNSFSQFWKQVK